MIAFIIAIAWSGFTIWRIYLLARFFQIEEYNVPRFLRWASQKPKRLFPLYSIIGAAFGIIASLLLLIANASSPILYSLIWFIAGGIAVIPEPLKEIKKRFVRTQRAKRLLATAFTLVILINFGLGFLILTLPDDPESLHFTLIGLIGLAAFWAAPLCLSAANYLMYPVESTLRRGFREKSRRRYESAGRPIVIGITGSYGKTSTKEYIAHILNGKYKVLATPKSYNTLMGVCITINNDLDPHYGYEYFVVEMGAYIRGEIRRICNLVRPSISVVTAVGPQHLERFGSLENTTTAKYEIIAALPDDGVGVFNADDSRVKGMADRGHPVNRWLISCAESPHEEARLVALNVQQTLNGLAFEVLDRQTNTRETFQTTLIGLHNVTNVLLASAVALHSGMTLPEIAMRVRTLTAPDHRLRSNTTPQGITIIDDAYNTNPVGAANALQVLALHPQKRILITPGMVEMGEMQDSENEKLGRLATQHCTHIVLVGIEQTQPIQRGIKSTAFPPDNLLVFDTLGEAITWYQSIVQAGDAVLFLNDLPDIYF